MSTPQTEKRLVLKGKYMAYLAEKVASLTGGIMLLVTGGVLSLGFLIGALSLLTISGGWAVSLILLLLGILPISLAREGTRVIKEARAMERLVPITRHNASQLSAEESLVRPSASDSRPRNDVLLRAVTEVSVTSGEGLLRAPDGAEPIQNTSLETSGPDLRAAISGMQGTDRDVVDIARQD